MYPALKFFGKYGLNQRYGFLITVLFIFVLSTVGLYAQTDDQNYMRTFHQRGSATRTMRSNELVGAHANLPLGTKILVTNLQNDRQITITITGRIAASGTRIIDLSQVAAIALRMGEQDSTSVSIEIARPKGGQGANTSQRN
jgi:rare lipoprotein A